MDTSLLRIPTNVSRHGVGYHKSVSRSHLRMLPSCNSKSEVSELATSTSSSSQPHSLSGRARATFKASKIGRQPIQEAQRPLSEYMALPASQYSVLDARRIERVDESTFRCYVGELRFLTWSVEPVITVSVEVEECGCTIRLLSCKLQGSRFVEDINDKFTATMKNVVRWRVLPNDTRTSDSSDDDTSCNNENYNDTLHPQQSEQKVPSSSLSISFAAASASITSSSAPSHLSSDTDNDGGTPSTLQITRNSPESHVERCCDSGDGDNSVGSSGGVGGSKEIMSETTIQVDLEVPGWAGAMFSVPSLERVGSGVMQNVLNVMVPRFLVQLRTDYELWASGDKSRRPVGEL